MKVDPRLKRIVAAQPYPLLFATISGAHLYGFPSPDSDFDLRGAHILPLENVIGLEVRDETVEQTIRVPAHLGPLRREASISPQPSPGRRQPSPGPSDHPLPSDGRGESLAPAGEGQSGEGAALEVDIVSHDVRKFFGLLLKKNGYVLEQLFSPLIVHTTPEHEELKEICRPKNFDTSPCPLPDRGGEGIRTGVITRHHSHHYFGFAETQWKLFLKESPRRVKPLLYVYHVLLARDARLGLIIRRGPSKSVCTLLGGSDARHIQVRPIVTRTHLREALRSVTESAGLAAWLSRAERHR